jgi:hypothetical protein
MTKHIVLTVALVLAVSAVAQAGTQYRDAVMALNPTSYFRMEEAAPAYLDTLVDTTGNDVGVATWGISTLATSMPLGGVGVWGPDGLTQAQNGTDYYYGLEWDNQAQYQRVNTGNQDDLGVPGSQEYNQDNMTYSFFFKTGDDYGNDERVLVNVPGEDNDFKVILKDDNLVVTTSTDGWSTAYEGMSQTYDVTDQQWHHVVVVRNGDWCFDCDVYLDGVDLDWQNTCVTTNDSHGTSGGTTARIGARHAEYYAGWGSYDGYVDEVAIFSRALTSAEALGLYDAAVIPEPATMSLLALGGIAVLLRRKRG